MEASIFETIAQSFLQDYPAGTLLTDSELQDWVQAHPDGAAIKPDLAIHDPRKRIATLRRHLNEGGRSNSQPEENRFQIEIDDPKTGTFIVSLYADVMRAKAESAVGKSVNGAIKPLVNGRRAIASIKLDDLPDVQRETLETARDNIAAMEQIVKPTMAQEVKRIWVNNMARRGIAAEAALTLLEKTPELDAMRRLLKVTN